MSEIKSALIKSIFTPTMMGVIITSLVAPFIITKVNTNMENKKIQSELVTKILDMTKETDFNDDKQLKRYAIYAQIVKDNPDLFNVKLDIALDKANSLFSVSSQKKNQLEMIISDLDSLKLQKLEYGKNNLKLQEKQQSLSNDKNVNDDLQKEFDENAELIKKTQNEIDYKEAEKTRVEAEYYNLKRGY
jgi:hypothetical protein